MPRSDVILHFSGQNTHKSHKRQSKLQQVYVHELEFLNFAERDYTHNEGQQSASHRTDKAGSLTGRKVRIYESRV